MIYYHVSDTVVDVPKILEAKRPLDFGGGFYVTTSETQAKAEITVIQFTKADEKWLDFVCNNRSGKTTEEYDIVIGPVADDKVYRV